MSTSITCPNCNTTFNIDEALTADIEKSIKATYDEQKKELINSINTEKSMLEQEKAKLEETKRNENKLFLERLENAKKMQRQELENEIKLKTENEQKEKLTYFQNELKLKDEKLKQLNEKELEVLKLNNLLKEQQEQEQHNLNKLKITLETELKDQLSNEILLKEREKYDMEKRETDKKLADQTKLIEEMQRKMQQGSMQTQGEVQEIALEELLASAFPFDIISEVGKGKRGADCILIVRNEYGHECGKIIFESKRTKDFDKKWLPKLKEDALESGCDLCVLVSQVLPDDMRMFDQREGVWICKFNEVAQLVKALREGILNVARANKSQENRGEKKEMLYHYFTSNEFLQQMRAINEAYLYLKSSIDRERLQMEKIWKEREKQIDKVLLNNTYLMGTIKGIAGNDVDDIGLLE
jgi:hypothetical protein